VSWSPLFLSSPDKRAEFIKQLDLGYKTPPGQFLTAWLSRGQIYWAGTDMFHYTYSSRDNGPLWSIIILQSMVHSSAPKSLVQSGSRCLWIRPTLVHGRLPSTLVHIPLQSTTVHGQDHNSFQSTVYFNSLPSLMQCPLHSSLLSTPVHIPLQSTSV